jgi:hypothetical protein
VYYSLAVRSYLVRRLCLARVMRSLTYFAAPYRVVDRSLSTSVFFFLREQYD